MMSKRSIMPVTNASYFTQPFYRNKHITYVIAYLILRQHKNCRRYTSTITLESQHTVDTVMCNFFLYSIVLACYAHTHVMKISK